MSQDKSLTPRQQRFVEEYLSDFCGAAAARRAGYSETTAKEIAYEHLTKPHIRDAIQERAKQLSDKSGISVERWLREVGRIAFSDLRKLFNKEGYLKEPHEWDDDTAATIASLEVGETRTTKTSDGKWEQTRIRKVRTLDKKAALESLGKYFKVLTDKPELGVDDKYDRLIQRGIELAEKYGGIAEEEDANTERGEV